MLEADISTVWMIRVPFSADEWIFPWSPHADWVWGPPNFCLTGIHDPFSGNKAVGALSSLKVGCLHPVACTRSGSGFPSNATLVAVLVM
jgi:hypothetical protein